MNALDDTDRALLDLLRQNARRSIADLARHLGLARTTVQSRLERLERQRIIIGYSVLVDGRVEAAALRAHVMITVGPKQVGGIEAALRKMPEVRSLHSVSGAFDLLAVVAAASISELDAAIDRIGAVQGVERTTSAIVLSARIER